MKAPLVELVRHGHKRSTIRFDDRGIEYPATTVMPIYMVEPGEPHEAARRVTAVLVERVEYIRCRDLSDAHARTDGFRDRDELVCALSHFYPKMSPDSLLSVYSFGNAPSAV